MIVLTAQDPRSVVKKAIMRCPPMLASMGSFGPTGPRLVAYSSAEAATLMAATVARAQSAARILEREMWTIELASFQNRARNRSVLHANWLLLRRDKFMLQCKTSRRGRKRNERFEIQNTEF